MWARSLSSNLMLVSYGATPGSSAFCMHTSCSHMHTHVTVLGSLNAACDMRSGSLHINHKRSFSKGVELDLCECWGVPGTQFPLFFHISCLCWVSWNTSKQIHPHVQTPFPALCSSHFEQHGMAFDLGSDSMATICPHSKFVCDSRNLDGMVHMQEPAVEDKVTVKHLPTLFGAERQWYQLVPTAHPVMAGATSTSHNSRGWAMVLFCPLQCEHQSETVSTIPVLRVRVRHGYIRLSHLLWQSPSLVCRCDNPSQALSF